MGILSSSANLIKKLLPTTTARKIKERNNLIKRVSLGISNISNYVNKSSIIPNVVKKEVVHVFFFIQDQDGFSNKGIILDYGSYEYIDDEKLVFEYKEEGGLRFGYIEYKAFMSDSVAIVNLDITKSPPIRFNELIDTLKKNGNWRQKDFNKYLNNTPSSSKYIIL